MPHVVLIVKKASNGMSLCLLIFACVQTHFKQHLDITDLDYHLVETIHYNWTPPSSLATSHTQKLLPHEEEEKANKLTKNHRGHHRPHIIALTKHNSQ